MARRRGARYRPVAGGASSLSPAGGVRALSLRHLLRFFEGFLGGLVTEVGADREVHQLGQRVQDAARVTLGKYVADRRLDAADDEEGGDLGRLLGGGDVGADAVERDAEPLGRLLVLG